MTEEKPAEAPPPEEKPKKRTPVETQRELGKALKKHAAEDPLNQMRRRKS